MPSLIDLRRRIRSVRSTQQITKAMKMVAAAKLRRAQDRVIAARPYSGLLRQLLADVAAAALAGAQDRDPLLEQRPEKRVQLVVISGDKGLCGAFNANVIKGVNQFLAEHSGVDMVYELIGRKGRDSLRKRPITVTGEHVGVLNLVQYSDAAAVGAAVSERFRSAQIDAAYLIYNEFRSVLSQRILVSRLLPVPLSESTDGRDYLYEEPPRELLGRLLPRYVEAEVHRAMLESSAAEHAARMTAMDAATSNAGEMIDKLTLYMNRVRQASITKEIIEVVSGASVE